ncbi:hypothetical protein DYBT9275_00729 [Dyadobacter sp. CECT 9275]|uniref:Uncharacterized protein n=1 Tax=Dyadobacter helix TaxID=2822344 RepID=A0A916J9Y8_9BACT|nr:hypothetical protein [Dyadobacter sp. CECT 9275]CAG4991336.1 hypothetical protein DYBT9275_00729 [Dyadobacter sp. CECT 9275]
MNILTNPHFFSNLVLSFTGIYIFFRHFGSQPANNRLLWGIFLFCLSLNALTDLVVHTGKENLQGLLKITQAAEMTLGAVCLVSASWSLIRQTQTETFQLVSTISIGLLLLYCITWFNVEYIGLIIQSFCIVVTMIVSCLGLGGRQKSALWVIFAMMFLALASKSARLNIPMNPVDIYHYMLTLAIVCVGKAVKNEYKLLF